MRLALAALTFGFAWLAGAAASAGETPCWLDRGVLIVPAALGDIAGDFILDVSAPKSELHLTAALAAGIETPVDVATLRLAGLALDGASFEVASLNARTWGFPTNVVGVIGADVLAPFVVDIDFHPCRVALWAGPVAALAGAVALPIRPLDGAPSFTATAFDGRTALSGPFAIDTGSAGVRISDAKAAYSRPPGGDDWAWRLDQPARLAALTMPGATLSNVRAALQPGAPPDVVGSVGTDVWSRYAKIRIDQRSGRLELVPLASPSPAARGEGY